MPHALEGDLEKIIGPECFLCGHRVILDSRTLYFSAQDRVAPELPMHRDCAIIRPPQAIAALYHQRVGDAVNIPRLNPVQRMFRRLLLGER